MKLRYGGKDLTKKKEDKKEDVEDKVIEKKNKRNVLGKLGTVVGIVALGSTVALGTVGCEKDKNGGNGDAVSDVDNDGAEMDVDEDVAPSDVPEEDGTVIPGTCEMPANIPVADLSVSAGYGYDNEEDGTCRTEWGEGGCLMGVEVGDTVKLRTGDAVDAWTVSEVKQDDEGNDVLVLTKDIKKIEIDAEKSIYWESEYASMPTEVANLGNARLSAVCTTGICGNGVSADLDTMTGKVLVEVQIGETVERLLLSEQETETVEIDGLVITVNVGRITESQAYLSYSITNGIEQNENNMKVPISEGGTEALIDDVFGVSFANAKSADTDNAACWDTVAVVTLTDDSGITWDVEVPEGEIMELPSGIQLLVEKVLVDGAVGEYGEMQPTTDGAVRLVRVDGGEWEGDNVITLKKGESQPNLSGITMTLKEVRKYSLVEDTPDSDLDY